MCMLYLQPGGGKLAVFGSAHIFSDGYLDKEDNSLLQEVVFTWLTSAQEVVLNQIDAEDPEVRRGGVGGVSTPTRLPIPLVKEGTKLVGEDGASSVQCVHGGHAGGSCALRVVPSASAAPTADF